jgi:hypothetical protein
LLPAFSCCRVDPRLETHVDLYMWFKWRNPDIDPSRSFEFMTAFEL